LIKRGLKTTGARANVREVSAQCCAQRREVYSLL
jgi:hypothetical protein